MEDHVGAYSIKRCALFCLAPCNSFYKYCSSIWREQSAHEPSGLRFSHQQLSHQRLSQKHAQAFVQLWGSRPRTRMEKCWAKVVTFGASRNAWRTFSKYIGWNSTRALPKRNCSFLGNGQLERNITVHFLQHSNSSRGSEHVQIQYYVIGYFAHNVLAPAILFSQVDFLGDSKKVCSWINHFWGYFFVDSLRGLVLILFEIISEEWGRGHREQEGTMSSSLLRFKWDLDITIVSSHFAQPGSRNVCVRI